MPRNEGLMDYGRCARTTEREEENKMTGYIETIAFQCVGSWPALGNGIWESNGNAHDGNVCMLDRVFLHRTVFRATKDFIVRMHKDLKIWTLT